MKRFILHIFFDVMKSVYEFGRENLFFNFTNYLLELGAATRC